LIANYADNRGIPNLDARYSYVSWNMPDAMAGARGYALPTPAPGVSVTTTVQSGSGVYWLAPRTTGSPASTFRMLDPNGGNVGFDGARVYVVRVQ